MCNLDHKKISKAVESIFTFNDIAGILCGNDLKHNVDMIKEEAEEVQEAYDLKMGDEDRAYDSNLLKESCDLFIVILGMLMKMKQLGYDVEEALLEVTANNLTKYPLDFSSDDYAWVKLNNYSTYYDEKHKRHIIKNHTGKIMKPLGYKKADVFNFIPKAHL